MSSGGVLPCTPWIREEGLTAPTVPEEGLAGVPLEPTQGCKRSPEATGESPDGSRYQGSGVSQPHSAPAARTQAGATCLARSAALPSGAGHYAARPRLLLSLDVLLLRSGLPSSFRLTSAIAHVSSYAGLNVKHGNGPLSPHWVSGDLKTRRHRERGRRTGHRPLSAGV